ncbi:MAG: PspC domain-containing protein [Salinivirgaceae bacterium]|jgi:phage shock protein PspC (stress-responsive transcriptional regulator)|nr:PspC domain-containing protein [Salinivirgaceae bacterium]
MTQTISINLGGLLFHIDDEAYEILKSYLQAIERQFNDEKEKKDIILDIEARLSELFAERINRQKDLIRVDDVNAVISIMGEPHDFIEDAEEGPKATGSNYRSSKTSKRMYRDPDNRMLGGVCSGLGAYFRTDPWIFRALFIVFAIFFLSGFIIYLILWVAIPEAITSAQKLEMRGEPITVENIKNTVKNEFENVKRKMNL